jgi:hypothetical protein
MADCWILPTIYIICALWMWCCVGRWFFCGMDTLVFAKNEKRNSRMFPSFTATVVLVLYTIPFVLFGHDDVCWFVCCFVASIIPPWWVCGRGDRRRFFGNKVSPSLVCNSFFFLCANLIFDEGLLFHCHFFGLVVYCMYVCIPKVPSSRHRHDISTLPAAASSYLIPAAQKPSRTPYSFLDVV